MGGVGSWHVCAMAFSSTAVEVAKKENEERCIDTVAHFPGIPRALSLTFVSLALLLGSVTLSYLHMCHQALGTKQRTGDWIKPLLKI